MDDEKMIERKKVLLDIINDKHYEPMKVKELAILLNVPKENRQDLQEVLDTLLAEGKISITKKSKYEKVSNRLFIGEVIGTQKSFAFIKVEGDEEQEDVFVSESDLHGAMHNDKVQFIIKAGARGNDKKREGEVVKIIERSTNKNVGIYHMYPSGAGYVVSDNPKFSTYINISKGNSKGLVDGQKVVVDITEYPDPKNPDSKPKGVITEILGHIDDPGVDILSVIRTYNLPGDFPDEVKEQLKSIPDEVNPEDYEGRLDLRNLQTVTIDGEDAKDLDDAVTISKDGDNYTLGVHIADVTNYVKEGTPLDKEALKRATSIYLVDRVIPMLPHQLSNGICSLNQGKDRLALSCIMQIDSTGKVYGHQIAKTIINVDRRMSYTTVQKIIGEHEQKECEEYKDFIGMFELMQELAAILRAKRKKRGSIDFDFPETKIILDKFGVPIEIKPYERNTATKIIEDFMLVANETVAEDYFWQEVPFVYRTHENPDDEKIQKLCAFINNFGYSMKTNAGEIHPKEFQKLLEKIDGSPEEALISRLTLRSMKQARYTVNCSGHFGLAAKYYTHFTSPIRRYPDLQIHRIIKEVLDGKMDDRRTKHFNVILPEVANQSSLMERRADESERLTDKIKKVQYMTKHIGEEFEGVVSGITSYGMYIELPNTIEGMVRINALDDDYYYYDEENYQLVGKETGKAYKLGQKLTIKVVNADRTLNQIDFIVANQEESEKENE